MAKSRKILCLIDSLGSGGAQRQMTWLVRVLVDRGYEVKLLAYQPQLTYFGGLVENCGIDVEDVSCRMKFGRILRVRNVIRSWNPDCVISFLDTPNMIAILSSLGSNRTPVIVSERNNDYSVSWKTNLRFSLFRMAAGIICNSHSQKQFIDQNYPWLTPKTEVVVNCVDLDNFKPQATQQGTKDLVTAIIPATLCKRKNPRNLLEAVCELNVRYQGRLSVSWFGRKSEGSREDREYLASLFQRRDELNARRFFRFEEPRQDMHEIIRGFSFLILPSFREGVPNAICEGLASGIPVLASNIGDHPNLVNNVDLLFDPYSSADIARTLAYFINLPASEVTRIGLVNRRFAEECLSPERFGDQYEQIISRVMSAN
ncbi:glycosyltransferase family 4 protein [Pirellulaceae bacterium SH449]